MTQNERERLEKAHHAAQLLLADIRDIYANAESVILEELIVPHIKQVANIERMLGRLSAQK